MQQRTRERGYQASNNRKKIPLAPIRPIIASIILSIQGSKMPKSGSGESESEAPSSPEGVGCLS